MGNKYDANLIVIGAGSGGLVTAYIAAAIKARVILIEKGEMGGDCLNTGCVPSKSLIASAKYIHGIRNSGNYGIKSAGPYEPSTIDRPRRVHLSVKSNKASIEVTPQKWVKGQLIDEKSFVISSDYDTVSKVFQAPDNLVSVKPKYKKKDNRASEKPITKKEVRAVRFPKVAKIDKSVEVELNRGLIGQELAIKTILNDMQSYLGRVGPAAG